MDKIKPEEIKITEKRVSDIENLMDELDEKARYNTRYYSLIIFLILTLITGPVAYAIHILNRTATAGNQAAAGLIYIIFVALGGITYSFVTILLDETRPFKYPKQIFERERKRLYKKFEVNIVEYEFLIKTLEDYKNLDNSGKEKNLKKKKITKNKDIEAKYIEDTRETDKSKQKVFIVHGHDRESMEKTARFVLEMELKPIILREQASGGKTIIEKIEEYSDVDFAIVLLTPDDFGNSAKNLTSILPRARQNVIAELGYMMAKLGRDKICLLNKGVEIPSDFQGIVCVELNESEGWKMDLAKEMKKAGLEIDMNKLY
ncbi:MAG TPA: nucleotide-binding protein [Pyrinomonadaceae bacterium]|jgi:predicted nucleotide-binding protein